MASVRRGARAVMRYFVPLYFVAIIVQIFLAGEGIFGIKAGPNLDDQKTLDAHRGFGFILPEEAQADGKDLFFHRSDVRGSGYDGLHVGQEVEFDLGKDERRGTPKAFNVRSAPPA